MPREGRDKYVFGIRMMGPGPEVRQVFRGRTIVKTATTIEKTFQQTHDLVSSWNLGVFCGRMRN